MLTPVYTRQFERDLKLMLKRGKDAEKFKTVAKLLLSESALLPKHKDHKLSGHTQEGGTATSRMIGF
jgi:mRNA interferase YafQ